MKDLCFVFFNKKKIKRCEFTLVDKLEMFDLGAESFCMAKIMKVKHPVSKKFKYSYKKINRI